MLFPLDELDLIDPSLVEPLKEKIHKHYGKNDFGDPDFSGRLLTPNGWLWDLVLTGKAIEDGREEVLEIEQVLNKRYKNCRKAVSSISNYILKLVQKLRWLNILESKCQVIQSLGDSIQMIR